MTTPKKDNPFGENLYEIPTCTICLQELSSEITSLSCGHCFHVLCITQHFQYRGTCPNCQKRACLKQIRPLIFPLSLNSKTSTHLQSVLANLSVSEKKQIEQLLRQLKMQSQRAQRFRIQATNSQHQSKTKTIQIINLKEQIARKKAEIEELRKENLQFQEERESLRKNLMESQRTQAYIRNKLDKLEEQQKQYEQFRRYRKLMHQNSEQLIKLKSELEARDTPHAEMAKQFFEICQMCKLQEGKFRQSIKGLQAQLKVYSEEIARLKETVERKDKELVKLNEKIHTEKKKTDEVEAKYRRLKEKYLTGEEKQDSNLFSNVSRKVVVESTKNNLTFVSKEDFFQPSIEIEIRKPNFASSVKIGGLGPKKKDDKIRIK